MKTSSEALAYWYEYGGIEPIADDIGGLVDQLFEKSGHLRGVEAAEEVSEADESHPWTALEALLWKAGYEFAASLLADELEQKAEPQAAARAEGERHKKLVESNGILAHDEAIKAAALRGALEGIAREAEDFAKDKFKRLVAIEDMAKQALTGSAGSAGAGWLEVAEQAPILHDGEDMPVYAWDGKNVTEDAWAEEYDQPAGPAIGGWVKVGEWFVSDNRDITHWKPRVLPPPPAAEGGGL